MTAHILGAGASAHAGYPLASKLLQGLAGWLDRCGISEPWVDQCRNRIVQVRETFGSLDDFEGILGQLEEYGHKRVKPTSAVTYGQDAKDIWHDCSEQLMGRDDSDPNVPAEGFYPQYLRSDLISALREYFHQTERDRSLPIAYDQFAEQRVGADSTIVTFNYDVALERALQKAGKWDVGTGYGFTAFPDRVASSTTVLKLHGSVNWFQTPMQENPPPLIFPRDLTLLGCTDLTDPRIGQGGLAVNNPGTLILPDPHKQFFWGRFWEPLWSAAADGLRGAREVFIHGYSMPEADSKARQLLFENIDKTATVNVYCRGASSRIADEFRSRGFGDVKPFSTINFETWATSPR